MRVGFGWVGLGRVGLGCAAPSGRDAGGVP